MDKKYLLRIIGYVALALAALILIADIAVQIASSMVQEVETTATQLVQTGETVSVQGFIVRTERLLESSENGFVGYTAEDGERVAVGSTVADIYADTAENKQIFDSISEIDHRLELIGRAKSEKGIYTVISADQKISALRRQIDEANAKGIPIDSTLTDELLMMLYVRDIRSGKDIKEIESSLAAQRSSLQAQLGYAQKTVVSDEMGYFYSECDGYEGLFDGESVMNATISDFSSVLHREKQPTQTTGVIGKVVTDYNWYLVCELPVEQARGMNESKSYTVLFGGENGQSVQMTLARLVYEYGNEKCALVFQSDRTIEGFEYTRYQTVTIVQESFDGYRVPVSALRNLDGICGVYVLRGSIVEFREVRPVNVQDGMVTVDAEAKPTGDYKMLEYYDLIIVKGKELYVGRIID